MTVRLLAFARSETGTTAMEYAFVASVVSLACVAGSRVIGTKVAAMIASVLPGLSG